jgi:arginine deiminase
MHRPGPELQRMAPRHRERVLFRALPWVSRARQEHDVFSQALRDQGVEVLYLTELLQDSLEYQPARDEAIAMAVADASLGDELRVQLRAHLENLGPEALTQVLIAGLTPAEIKIGRGVVFELLDRHDFVLDPLPNLIFTRDASFWIGDQIAVASLAAERRCREPGLASLVYRHHPRFAGTKWLYQPEFEHLDGGDVLLLSPGVIAVGVGERTTPAGAERLARQVFAAGLAHAVLAVPMSQSGAGNYLDTACAVIDIDAVVMNPAVAYTLTAHTITPRAEGMRVSRPQPFLEAAAQAMGLARLRVIDPGTEPAGQRDHCDDGSNILAIGRRIAICHERNSQVNERLEDAGITVVQVPSSELGSIRGGPRSMSCPVSRDPAAMPADELAPAGPDARGRPLYRDALVLAAADEPTGPAPVWTEQPVPARAAASAVPVQLQPAAQASSQNPGKEKEELASASLTARRCQRRRPDARPIRKTPRSRPRTTRIAAITKSHHSTCMIVMTTKNRTIAAPISSKMRSICTRYGPLAGVVTTGPRRPVRYLAENDADQVVCATWS